MKLLKLTLPVIATVFLVGCDNTSHVVSDLEKSAKEFQPLDDKAVIYVFRDSGLISSEFAELEINDQYLGHTTGDTFVKHIVEPGQHTLTSRAENVAKLEIDAEPNSIYFVRQGIYKGEFTARTELSVVDDEAGKLAVKQARMLN